MRRALAVVALLLLATVTSQGTYQRIPSFEVETQIWASDGADGDNFGRAVDTDGTRIVVGAPDHGDGQVYVYIRQGDRWIEEAHIAAPAGGDFGAAVAIDDDRLIVGAPAWSAGGLQTNAGRVEVYERNGNSWRHSETWHCPDERRDSRCGEAVAAENDRILIGAPGGQLIQDLNPGFVYELDSSGSKLSLKHTESGDEANGLRFGAAVAMDGERILIGAPARLGTDNVVPGGAFFYDRHGSNWLPRGDVRADVEIGASETFGQNVAIDGDDAVVTTIPVASTDNVYVGGDAFFYERDGLQWKEYYQEWTELQTVAMHNGTVLLGAWFWDTIFVYQKYDPWGWYIVGTLGGWNFDDREGEYGVAMAFHDRVVAVGAPSADGKRGVTGATFAYYDNWSPWAYAGQDRTIDDLDENGFETVTLDGRGSWDYDGTIVSYDWYLDDTFVGSGETLDIDIEIGEHLAVLEVEDDLGATDRDTARIIVRTPVTEAAFSWSPERPWPFDWVRFIESSSDQRAPITSWAWDMDGDGFTDSTQREPYHVFEDGGPHDVTLTTTNLDGGTLTAKHTIQVRNAPPQAFGGWSRVVPLDDPGLTGTTTLDGSGSTDDDGIISWQWRSTTGDLGDGERVEATFTRGTHTVWLEVQDREGYWDQHGFTILALPAGANETAAIRPAPSFRAQEQWGRTWEFEDTSSTSGPSIAIWQWDFNEDGEPDAEGRRIWHEFEEPGEHAVHLTIIDQEGARETTKQIVRVDNHDPYAWFWPDYAEIPVGGYLVFYGPPEDEAPLAKWDWTFSDGSRSRNTDVGHRFDQLGTVDITLEVTDDGGRTASHTGRVEVLTLADWEARYGQYVPEALANATEEEAPEALGGRPDPDKPRVFTATETYDPPAPEPLEEEDEPFDPGSYEVLGIPAWIPLLLLLLLVALLLIILPMRRKRT